MRHEFSLSPDPGTDCAWSGAWQRLGLRYRSLAPGCRVCPHGRCDHRALCLSLGEEQTSFRLGYNLGSGLLYASTNPDGSESDFQALFGTVGTLAVVGERGLAENWSVGGRIRGSRTRQRSTGARPSESSNSGSSLTDVAVWSHHSRSLGERLRIAVGPELRFDPRTRQENLQAADLAVDLGHGHRCGRAGIGGMDAGRAGWSVESARGRLTGIASMTRMRCQPPHGSRPTPGSPPATRSPTGWPWLEKAPTTSPCMVRRSSPSLPTRPSCGRAVGSPRVRHGRSLARSPHPRVDRSGGRALGAGIELQWRQRPAGTAEKPDVAGPGEVVIGRWTPRVDRCRPRHPPSNARPGPDGSWIVPVDPLQPLTAGGGDCGITRTQQVPLDGPGPWSWQPVLVPRAGDAAVRMQALDVADAPVALDAVTFSGVVPGSIAGGHGAHDRRSGSWSRAVHRHRSLRDRDPHSERGRRRSRHRSARRRVPTDRRPWRSRVRMDRSRMRGWWRGRPSRSGRFRSTRRVRPSRCSRQEWLLGQRRLVSVARRRPSRSRMASARWSASPSISFPRSRMVQTSSCPSSSMRTASWFPGRCPGRWGHGGPDGQWWSDPGRGPGAQGADLAVVAERYRDVAPARLALSADAATEVEVPLLSDSGAVRVRVKSATGELLPEANVHFVGEEVLPLLSPGPDGLVEAVLAVGVWEAVVSARGIRSRPSISRLPPGSGAPSGGRCHPAEARAGAGASCGTGRGRQGQSPGGCICPSRGDGTRAHRRHRNAAGGWSGGGHGGPDCRGIPARSLVRRGPDRAPDEAPEAQTVALRASAGLLSVEAVGPDGPINAWARFVGPIVPPGVLLGSKGSRFRVAAGFLGGSCSPTLHTGSASTMSSSLPRRERMCGGMRSVPSLCRRSLRRSACRSRSSSIPPTMRPLRHAHVSWAPRSSSPSPTTPTENVKVELVPGEWEAVASSPEHGIGGADVQVVRTPPPPVSIELGARRATVTTEAVEISETIEFALDSARLAPTSQDLLRRDLADAATASRTAAHPHRGAHRRYGGRRPERCPVPGAGARCAGLACRARGPRHRVWRPRATEPASPSPTTPRKPAGHATAASPSGSRNEPMQGTPVSAVSGPRTARLPRRQGPPQGRVQSTRPSRPRRWPRVPPSLQRGRTCLDRCACGWSSPRGDGVLLQTHLRDHVSQASTKSPRWAAGIRPGGAPSRAVPYEAAPVWHMSAQAAGTSVSAHAVQQGKQEKGATWGMPGLSRRRCCRDRARRERGSVCCGCRPIRRTVPARLGILDTRKAPGASPRRGRGRRDGHGAEVVSGGLDLRQVPVRGSRHQTP